MALPLINTAAALAIGEPCVVHSGTGNVSVVITCRCHPENVPMVLKGADCGALCLNCGNVYQIVKAEYDVRFHEGGIPLVGVAVVARQSKESSIDA